MMQASVGTLNHDDGIEAVACDDVLALLLAAWSEPGATDPLTAALRVWLRSDGRLTLQRLAGLGTPRSARRVLRDHYLRQAAALLHRDDARPWTTACRLAEAVDCYVLRRWPMWSGYATPPQHASALDALLHQAATVGDGAMPSTPEGLLAYVRAKPIDESP